MFKTFAVVATTFALMASTAFANNSFGFLSGAEQGETYYDVDLVRTLGEGIVQIETLKGRVIGTSDVHAGTNTNVRVRFELPISGQDLIAKLIIGGNVVQTARIEVRR